MVDGVFLFAGVLGVFALITFQSARKSYTRYQTATELIDDSEQLYDENETTTIHGPVSVSEPAIPDRMPPANADTNDDDPAVWAWRVRSKERRGSGKRSKTRWRTTESGLAIGEFTIRQDWEDVAVDANSVPSETPILQGSTDPYEASNWYLGEPEENVLLGERDPINKRLETWGITGDDGVLSGWEFTISFGRQTMTPDRYQATIIRDGDEILIRGMLDETEDQSVLRDTAENPLVVAVGNLDEKADQLRTSARKEAILGSGLVALALFVVILGVL